MKIPIPHLFRILGLLFIFSLPQAAISARHALLVGIGQYDTQKTGWRKIHGDADVNLLSPLLQKRGFKVQTLVNSQATKDNIISSLSQLAKKCSPGDIVYFHFSGHGQRIPDYNGDEKDGYDESIVPFDALRSPGYETPPLIYNGQKHLTDDELGPLLENIRKRLGPSGELTAVFDACYSRGIEKGGDEEWPENFDFDTLPEFIRGTSDIFLPSDKSYLLTIPAPAGFRAGCPTEIITACLENERNFEVKVNGRYYGALSYCISLLLRNGIPLREWIPYFQSGSYRSSNCFQPFQNPSITLYK